MSAWLRTWLPTLPSIDFSLPSSIQRRFLSFALRQALGHLLKPGQLDAQQVDAQIGSGFVQVRDVELDNEAINSLITGLPIQLHDGSVGKVTARIPWPNPLTATIGLSLESLHLTFNIIPIVTKDLPVHSNLAESVTSVAETFIHDELGPEEEAALRGSFHPDLNASDPSFDNIPGGLDPFLTDEASHNDAEPSGVSIFATLLERLLSRFQFDATDIKITFVHPEHASFTISVPSIRYQTEVNVDRQNSRPSSSATGEHGGKAEGTARTVSISGVTVTTRYLRSQSPQLPPSLSLAGPVVTHRQLPASPEKSVISAVYFPPSSPTFSDSSDIDEETHMLMSQSLVNLPPRPPSPASSVASSMYQSAISVSHSDSSESISASRGSPVMAENEDGRATPTSPLPPTDNAPRPNSAAITTELQDETILSFGSEPIVVRLTTPAPVRRAAEAGSPSSKESPGFDSPEDKERRNTIENPLDALKLEVSLDVIAIALKARHIRSLLDILQLWASHTPSDQKLKTEENDDKQRSHSLFDHLEAKLQIRGVMLLLLPAQSPSHPDATDDLLTTFFNRPLISPRLPHGYVRAHLDAIDASLTIRPTSEPIATRNILSQSSSTTIISFLSLSELSVFAFLATSNTKTGVPELAASPILITDPNLLFQYSSMHIRPDLRQSDFLTTLPSFEIIDWTDPAQQTSIPKPTFWRAKLPQGTKHSSRRTAHLSSPRHGSADTSPFTNAGEPEDGLPRSHMAVTAKFTIISRHRDVRTSRSKGKDPISSIQLQVEIAPLHAFCDLALVLETNSSPSGSKALAFLEELASSDTGSDASPGDIWRDESDSDDDDDDDDDDDTPPATPRPYATHRSERDKERERKRLERLVLEDLDLGYDYRQSVSPESIPHKSGSRVHDWQKRRKRSRKSHETMISIMVPMIRIESRTSPHPTDARSGALVLDIRDLNIFPGNPPHFPAKRTTRFTVPEDDPEVDHLPVIRQDVESALVFGECERLVLAYSLSEEPKANVLFSLGSVVLTSDQEDLQSGWTGSPQSRSTSHTSARIRPQFTTSRSSSKPSPAALELTTLTVTVDIPSIYVRLCKPVLDGLQLWADDLSQMVERCSGSNVSEADAIGSRDPSLIGSRFFAKTRRSHDSGTDSASVVSAQRTTASTETIVKALVTDVAIRLDIPRQSYEGSQTRPFDIIASNVDVLLEVNPEGKDQTVVTVGITDLNVVECSKDHTSLVFLGPTQTQSDTSNVQPLLKLRFVSLILPETNAKESRVKVTLHGVTYTLHPDQDWMSEIAQFFKAPPGVFESVVPSERTRISIKLLDSSIRTLASTHPGSLVLHIGELDFSTVLVGNLPEMSLHVLVQTSSLFLIDDISTINEETVRDQTVHKVYISHSPFWKALGYALILEVHGFDFRFTKKLDISPPDIKIIIDGADIRLHLCADTGGVLGAFIGALVTMFSNTSDSPAEVTNTKQPTEVASPPSRKSLLASLDEHAFLRQVPQVGPAPDLVNDDLPNNLDYLDDSFGTAGGLRALDEDDFDENFSVALDQPGIIAKYGGETVRLLDSSGLHITENYFDALPHDSTDEGSQYGDTTLRVQVHDCNASVFLYDGYDWQRTRRIIEEKQKEIRRRLTKIRQLVANGQTPDPSVEETNTLLFNSVYIGLEHNVDELEPGALIAAIDDELNEDIDASSQSSWQSLKPQQLSPVGASAKPTTNHSPKRLARSRGPCIDFRLQHLDANIDNYRSDPSLASRTLITIRDVEILDHIRTSTWSKFLTSLSTDSKGNIRETGSNMVRVELQKVYPVLGNLAEEARLKAKLLPLRLYVDQDALDFMKKFFSFNDSGDSEKSPESSEPSEEIFFQQVEVFPVDIKLDYKPRRVDYRALRAGKTIELMNFFHFDGAEMTLRHITLTGITGWARVGDLLNDLWTPDVKATQLVDVISGVAPIRSVVNVGSGVADLVLLPIAQYRKDGRVIRGLQKGTTAFVQSTAVEAIKLGARLATGTQVILEQAEHVIGGQFTDSVTAEAVQLPAGMSDFDENQGEGDDSDELISRYAEQPMNVKEGVKSAVKSLRRNLNSAAQTILAVPMEVYERSGNEGAVRAVVRAVPIAVLRPMIGASEAVSKTLMGIHNSLDPNVRAENEAKYKHR